MPDMMTNSAAEAAAPPPAPALPKRPSRAEFLADLGVLAPWDVVPGTERENWGCHKPNPHGQPERQAKKEQAEEFRRYRDEMLDAGRKCPYGFALRMGKDGVLLDDIEHRDRGECLWPLLTNEATLRSIGRKYKSWKELGRKDPRNGHKRKRKDTRRGRKDPRTKRKDTRTGRARPDLRLKERKMAAEKAERRREVATAAEQ